MQTIPTLIYNLQEICWCSLKHKALSFQYINILLLRNITVHRILYVLCTLNMLTGKANREDILQLFLWLLLGLFNCCWSAYDNLNANCYILQFHMVFYFSGSVNFNYLWFIKLASVYRSRLDDNKINTHTKPVAFPYKTTTITLYIRLS